VEKKFRIFLACVTSEVLKGPAKKFSPFGPAIWPAFIGNTYAYKYIYVYLSKKPFYLEDNKKELKMS